MLKTKYEYNFYSFYDHTGMEQHFEKMAAQGWLIEKLGYFWRYRRIGPQALRFSVVYYSEASEFDPTKPSEGELTFYDFCAQAGWNKAASRAQMNVFYNEDANAVPIETDAALQVETLHQSMKKEQLIAWFLMLALALWIFFDMRMGFIRDFAAALSCLSALSAILILCSCSCCVRWSLVATTSGGAGRSAKPSLEDSCRRAHILCYRCWRSWCW